MRINQQRQQSQQDQAAQQQPYALYESHPKNAFKQAFQEQMQQYQRQQKVEAESAANYAGSSAAEDDYYNQRYDDQEDDELQRVELNALEEYEFGERYSGQEPRKQAPYPGTDLMGQAYQQQYASWLVDNSQLFGLSKSLSKQELNLKMLEAHRLGVSPTTRQYPANSTSEASMMQTSPSNKHQQMYTSISARRVNTGIPTHQQITSASPSSKQRMAPRTMQPSSKAAARLPPEPKFTQAMQLAQQKEKQNKRQEEQSSQATEFRVESSTCNLVLNNQSHTFGIQNDEMDQEVVPEQRASEHPQMADESVDGASNQNYQVDSAHQQDFSQSHGAMQTKQQIAESSHQMSENVSKVGGTERASHAGTTTSHLDPSEQPSRTLSVRQQNEFLLKQQQYEQRKQEKIRKAQEAKLAREASEFEKNATFKPVLVANSLQKRRLSGKPSDLVKQQNSSTSHGRNSPANFSSQGRTLKQFISDQERYMFKSQRKIDEQRTKRDLDLSKELTGRPRLNPKSERICDKIHAQFVANVNQGNLQLQGSTGQLAAPVGQEGPLPKQTSRVKQDDGNFATPAMKQQSTQIEDASGLLPKHMVSSPAAQQLLARKRALAKAVPQLPSFKPKINQRSAKLVQQQVQKRHEEEQAEFEGLDRHAKLSTQKPGHQPSASVKMSDHHLLVPDSEAETEKRFAIDSHSPIRLEEEVAVRIRTEPDYLLIDEKFSAGTDDGQSVSNPVAAGYLTTIKQARTTTAKQHVSKRTFDASSQQSPNTSVMAASRVKTSQSPQAKLNTSHLKARPRIADLKAQTQKQEAELVKKMKAEQSKKHNENLVLRNFKKEFDSIMIQLGLGPAQTRDMDDSKASDRVQTNTSLGTIRSETIGQERQNLTTIVQPCGVNNQEATEETVRVDLALVLHLLGFLPTPSANQQATQQYLDQYICLMDDKDQKTAFKANLFTILAAIQSINLRDHFKLYGSFGTLQQHILEDIVQQVDQACSSYHLIDTSQASGAQSQRSNTATSSAIGPLLEALLQLAMQPFPFSITHQHLVKLHFTFMSLFLNRKDNISKGYRVTLELEQKERFGFSPRIEKTQQSFSPPLKRAPMNEPNRYYDELKRNIRERAAKMQSLQAANQRTIAEECTFRPAVNPTSTKIAYKQVAEMHVRQKDFMKTYTFEAPDDDEKLRQSPKKEEVGADQLREEAKVSTTGRSNAVNQAPYITGFQSRISNRIGKMVREFVTDKRTGRKQDVPTEQKEYDRAKKELSFKPDIAKSQLSHNLKLPAHKSPKSSPRADKRQEPNKSPTSSPQKSPSRQAHRVSSAGSTRQSNVSASSAKKKPRTPVGQIPTLSMFHSQNSGGKYQLQQKLAGNLVNRRSKQQPSAVGFLKPIQLSQHKVPPPKRNSPTTTKATEGRPAPQQIVTIDLRCTRSAVGGGAGNSVTVKDSSGCSSSEQEYNSPAFPSLHQQTASEASTNQQQMLLKEDDEDPAVIAEEQVEEEYPMSTENQAEGAQNSTYTGGSTAEFVACPGGLHAPPSVVDILCYNTTTDGSSLANTIGSQFQLLKSEETGSIQNHHQPPMLLTVDQMEAEAPPSIGMQHPHHHQSFQEQKLIQQCYLFESDERPKEGHIAESGSHHQLLPGQQQRKDMLMVQDGSTNPFMIDVPRLSSQVLPGLQHCSSQGTQSSGFPTALLRPTQHTMSSQSPLNRAGSAQHMAISVGTQSPLHPQAELDNQAPALELAHDQTEENTTSKFDQQCKVSSRDAALRITESPQGAEEDDAYEPASCSEGNADMGEMGHQQQHRFQFVESAVEIGMIGSRDGGDNHIMANVDQDDRLRNSEQFRPSDLQLKNEDMPRLHRVHLDNSLSGRRLLTRGGTVNCDASINNNLTSAEAMPPSAIASSPKLLLSSNAKQPVSNGSPGVHHSPSSPQLGTKQTNISAANVRNVAEPSYGDESSTNAEAIISTTNMVFHVLPQDNYPQPVSQNAPASTMFYDNGDQQQQVRVSNLDDLQVSGPAYFAPPALQQMQDISESDTVFEATVDDEPPTQEKLRIITTNTSPASNNLLVESADRSCLSPQTRRLLASAAEGGDDVIDGGEGEAELQQQVQQQQAIMQHQM